MGRKRNLPKKIKPLVDIIIPVFHRFDILDDCLKAIPAALGTIPYEIYIYDDGSERLEANAFYDALDKTQLSITRSGTNKGFPTACNSAYKKGRAPLVFFVNSDVILEPGSVDKLVRAMDDPNIGIAGMKLVFPTGEQLTKTNLVADGRPPQKLQHIGLVSTINGKVEHVFSGWDANHPKVNAVSTENDDGTFRDPLAVTGAALMTRRKLFAYAGMFWEGYGRGTWEDVDFSMTVKEMGKRVVVVPEAVATHYTNATAIQQKTGFPMGENYQKFLLRWKSKLKQTDIDVL